MFIVFQWIYCVLRKILRIIENLSIRSARRQVSTEDKASNLIF